MLTRRFHYAIAFLIASVVFVPLGIAHPPGGATITNEAFSSFLFKTGQRIITRSNTTETIVQTASIASVLTLSVSSEALIGNGTDSCFVESMVYDAAGNPVPDGQPVAFITTAGTFSNGTDTVYATTIQGKAATWLRSSVLSGQTIIALVTSQTIGINGMLSEQSSVIFFRAAIAGAISSGGNESPQRYQGIIIRVYDNLRREIGRDTTNANGSFLIPIEQSGTYTISFDHTNAFGDVVEWHASVFVEVPPLGGVPATAPLNSIGGILVDASTGQAVRKNGIGVILNRTDSNNLNMGRTTPAFASTDDRGLFAFDSLAPGSYELLVLDVRYAGTLLLPAMKPGTFIIDADVALVAGPTFEVVKTSNKRIAEIGDAITYNLEIKNLSADASLRNVRLVDELPLAFVYAKNSGRRAGASLPEPSNSRRLEWDLGDSLKPGEVIKVSYSVHVGTAALDGDGINKAYAVAQNMYGQTVRTAVASVQVLVRPGVFTDRGIVIGKIFYDKNENGNQDFDENGIPGVQLWMEDGTHIVTGDEGKYSLPEVQPGQHVLRVDERTLPVGATALAIKSQSAGDGLSRFVQLSEGGIARADFYVRPSTEASLKTLFTKIDSAGNEQIHARYIIELRHVGSPSSVSVTDTLPKGFSFDLRSVTWHKTKLPTDRNLSRSLKLDFPARHSYSSDSMEVTIVPDSAEGEIFSNRSVLTLTYKAGRTAVFSGVAEPGEGIQPAFVTLPSEFQQPKDTSAVRETILTKTTLRASQ